VQFVQAPTVLSPVVTENVPAGQAVQALAFWRPAPVEYVPALQLVHAPADASPSMLEYVPAVQFVQLPELPAPTVAENLPAGQNVHCESNPFTLYVPAGQGWHAVETPSTKNVPGPQQMGVPIRLQCTVPPAQTIEHCASWVGYSASSSRLTALVPEHVPMACTLSLKYVNVFAGYKGG